MSASSAADRDPVDEPHIRVLPDVLINQIAAGEVVERPASVAKELIENAIDAGATSIVVEIYAGGIDLVRVTDDGSGMSPADARLAIERHATSKIASLDDLLAIGTFGFRGEALPSIASVSRFALTTRRPSAVGATRIKVEGGGDVVVEETGAAPGTTVEVADLFVNVPARRKFLKSLATESALVTEVVLRAALAHPKVRFQLRRDGRKARTFVPAPDDTTRMRDVFPEDALAEVRGEHDGVSVLAMLGSPQRARASTATLFAFVNKRPVRDRGLVRAVAHAYGSVLEPGRFPAGVVFVELDLREVDVNAHPQKAEVRFAKPRAVYDAVARVIAEGLARASWSLASASPGTFATAGRAADAGGPMSRPSEWWVSRLGGSPAGAPAASFGVPIAHLGPVVAAPGGASDASAAHPRADAGTSDPWGLAPDAPAYPPRPYAFVADPGATLAVGDTARLAIEPARGAFGALRFIAQLRRMWLLCESDDGLHVLDQHAAAERVTFDRLRRAHRCATVETQRMLFPDRVELSESHVALLAEREQDVAAIGLETQILGPTSVLVHAVPKLVARASPARLLGDVLTEMSREGGRAFADAVDLVLATMACHGSVRAGDVLSPEECRALLVALDDVDFGG
ncbi:MAG: DNA mismatch repair endonuclease MutL, partial [Deltaproteobacteria bacterium]|nr:DNA mismatch repair endonuclease MutL [Deltaproteobacteria bacterium]